MTSRERWVVYPLLFLALGTALRDKIAPRSIPFNAQQINAHSIHCDYLDVGMAECRAVTVGAAEGEQGVQIGTAPDGAGWLRLSAADGTPIVVAGADDTGRSGAVEVLNSQAVPQVQLRSTRFGGTVTTVGQDNEVWLVMGHEGPYYGVFAQSPQSGRGTLLTLPCQFEGGPAAPGPPGSKPSNDQPAKGNDADR